MKITTVIHQSGWWEDDERPRELKLYIEWLKEKLASIPKQYQNDAYVFMDEEKFQIVYEMEETTEAATARINKRQGELANQIRHYEAEATRLKGLLNTSEVQNKKEK